MGVDREAMRIPIDALYRERARELPDQIVTERLVDPAITLHRMDDRLEAANEHPTEGAIVRELGPLRDRVGLARGEHRVELRLLGESHLGTAGDLGGRTSQALGR